MTLKVILLFFLLHLSSFSHGQHTYQYSQPKELTDGWKTSDLKSQNVDSTLIYKLFSQLHNGEHKIHSALLIKDDKILIEEYFDKHEVDMQHGLRSVNKSIISILMGIAIDKGYIESLDDPILKYLKSPIPNKNLDTRKNQITIKNLLTMSTGLDCNDWNKSSKGQEGRVYKKNDWLQYFLDLPMVNEPGEVSNYCSIGVVLAAEIISQASGMAIEEFVKQYLFVPLGISNVSWGHTSKKAVIPSGRRMYMTPRDMAKIGKLILNKGMWDEQQIVSEEWIIESTSLKTKITGIDYGYLWWTIPFKINEKKVLATVATGNGGQYIMIFPDQNMIAVFTGGAYNSQDDKLPFAIIQKVFLPTFSIDR